MTFSFLKKKLGKATPLTAAVSTEANSRRDSNKKTTEASTVVELPNEPSIDIFGGDEAAKAANHHEQSMTLKYTMRYYYIAIIWAAIMAAPIIMEGYETAMVPNFFSFDAFQQKYGTRADDALEWTIPTAWQSGITMSAAAGQLIGLWIAPRVVNRRGYRTCSAVGLIWAGLCLMLGFWSMDTGHPLVVFLIGELLLGVPWGLFQGITLPYVSDITPLKLKGIATTLINVFWLVGQMMSAAVMRGASQIASAQWKVKAPMLIQYSWLIPLLFLVYMAPESPLYLSRNDRDEQAKAALRRLNKDPLFNEEGTLAMIRAVNLHEKETSAAMGLRGCFRGINLRRTETAVIIYVTQQWVGTPLMFYSVRVLEKGGLSQDKALVLTIGMYALCIVSTMVSSTVAMKFFGRRTLWIGGLAGEIACLGAIGTLSFHLRGKTSEPQDKGDLLQGGVPWAIAAFLILFAVIYNFTIGPLCYTIVAETPATRLKAATNSLSRGIYILFAMLNLVLVPNLLEDRPVGIGLGTKAALIWAGSATLCLIWAYFRLPEMKDRTPAEVDLLFENKVRARDWSKTVL
ncbi:Sugar/inositol transporter [Metarhizium rileyi]|uniref:Sugar/inositol transporter n=1 Tax=Metarhizium rileyi (strain RCEF 4871) TaxID=1649241 RepID=A0A167A6V1_METRR|nr:Sugar/inositol transporter [Metarhizium rileyi RCEF 4871]TWU73520.1 hypothetical protein ED733_002775 [Metarhizium rileyi]